MVLRGLYEKYLMFSQKELMHRAWIQKDEELASAELHFWKWSYCCSRELSLSCQENKGWMLKHT